MTPLGEAIEIAFLVIVLCVAAVFVMSLLGFIISPLWDAIDSNLRHRRQVKAMNEQMHKKDHRTTLEHIKALEEEMDKWQT